MFENSYIRSSKTKVIINKEELLNWKVEPKTDKRASGAVTKKKKLREYQEQEQKSA